MKRLLENLAATVELMGQSISPTAISMMARDLSKYPTDTVIEALQSVRNTKSRFTQDAVVKEIERLTPDGRPGADEAWAMIPRDEYASCVMTEEMSGALHVAQPLLYEGDQVAARMAFKEAYARLVDTAKRAGTPVRWTPSLGYDKEGRESCLAEAVRLGRMSAEHAIKLLPPDKVAPMLEQAGNETLAIEYKPGTSEVARQNIAKMKAMLAGSIIGRAV